MCIAAVAAGASLELGCTSSKVIRIGFIGGLGGRVSDLGIGGLNGTQIAVERLNESGGLGGRQLELLARDDEQDADQGQHRLGELIDAGAELVIGPMTSSIAKAIVPIANRRRIPLISPLAGANELSGKDDTFFRVVSDSANGARQQAKGLLARGAERLVTLGDTRNVVFTRSWNAALSQRFREGGGTVVEDVEFEAAPGLRFLELARRVAATPADVVAIAASAADCAVLVQHLRRIRPAISIGLSAWAGTEELPQLGGGALEGVLVTQFFDRSSTSPRWLDFVAHYRARFDAQPGYAALNGHDSVQMVATASAVAARAGWLEALRQVREVDGLQRILRFDKYGDCLAPTYLTEVRNGRYVAVAT